MRTQNIIERRVSMYIEKLQISSPDLDLSLSMTFQKGVFSPEGTALDSIDILKILSFFFYGRSAVIGSKFENVCGTLHFCENSFHYRINAGADSSKLYKITAVGEEQIELEDNVNIGQVLFDTDAETFEATLGFNIYHTESINEILADLVGGKDTSFGIYDLMNRIRDGANTAKSSEGEVQEELARTIVMPAINDSDDPLEATRVLSDDKLSNATPGEAIDELDQTIKIAPAPDLEIEALESRIRKIRSDIDSTSSELEEISRKIEVGKMSDLSDKIAAYKQKKALYEKALEDKRAYEDTYRAGTLELPDNDYVNELEFAIEEIKSCESELKSIHEERESVDPDHHNNKLSNLYIKVEDDGGIDAIRARLKHFADAKRIYMLSSIFFTIAGVVLILAGAAISLLPIYKNMFIANTVISVAHIGLFILTMGLMCLIPALTSISGMQNMHESTYDVFVEYGCEGEHNAENFLYTLELAINESEEKKQRLAQLRKIEKKVAKCQGRVNEGQRIIREHLTIWDRVFDSRLSYCENALGAIAAAKEFLSKYEGLKNEAKRARDLCDEAGYFIMGFEDKIFSEDFDPAGYKMSEEEIEKSEARSDALKDKLNNLYDALDSLKRERDMLVFAENEQKQQKASNMPDPWLCELIDKLEAIANNDDTNAWKTALARAQMISAKQKTQQSHVICAATLLLASFETFYNKVMPPQFIKVDCNKEEFASQIEDLFGEFVSDQIVIY